MSGTEIRVLLKPHLPGSVKPITSEGPTYDTVDAAVDSLTSGGWVYVP